MSRTTARTAVAALTVTRRTSTQATAAVGRGVAARARPVSHAHTAGGGALRPGTPGTPVAVPRNCRRVIQTQNMLNKRYLL